MLTLNIIPNSTPAYTGKDPCQAISIQFYLKGRIKLFDAEKSEFQIVNLEKKFFILLWIPNLKRKLLNSQKLNPTAKLKIRN